MANNLQIKILLFFFIFSLAHSKKGELKKNNKDQAGTVNILDDTEFKHGAKIGFTCKQVQKPRFRSLKRQPKIIFETITIIKKTKIIIEGDSQFDFVCRRDQSTDKGDVRPPNEVDKDVPVTDSDDYYDDELTTTEDNKKKEDYSDDKDYSKLPDYGDTEPSSTSEYDYYTDPEDDQEATETVTKQDVSTEDQDWEYCDEGDTAPECQDDDSGSYDFDYSEVNSRSKKSKNKKKKKRMKKKKSSKSG